MISNNVLVVLTCLLLTLRVCCASQEWDCDNTTTTGTFARSNDCTIQGSDHILVSNILEIEGSNKDMNNLVTITAANGKRHFAINEANAKLILRYIKLSGGDVSGGSSNDATGYGGSILVNKNNGAAGELNLYSSIIDNNKAYRGGGIFSYGTVKIDGNSIIRNNEASN